MNYPRLGQALRILCDVVDPTESRPPPKQNLTLLRQRRLAEAAFSWTDLKERLEKELWEWKELQKTMAQLLGLAKEVVGSDCSQQVIRETAVELFRMFLDESMLTQSNVNKLKRQFGSADPHVVKQLMQLVQSVRERLSDEATAAIKAGSKQDNCGDEFGKNITYRFPAPFTDCTLTFHKRIEGQKADSEFSLAYSNVMAVSSKLKVDAKEKQQSQEAAMYGRRWLEDEIKKSYKTDKPAGMSLSEFASTLLTLLGTSKRNDELQNEIFEFLGFDRFELTQTLLQNRSKILAETAPKSNTPAGSSQFLQSVSQLSEGSSRPIFGCQVFVFSEGEKQLRKQFRKEERKFHRVVAASRADAPDEDDKFDPMLLRMKRNESLIAAVNQPIIRTRILASHPPKEVYPHVYDLYAHARQSAGFISGVKMVLPEGFERTENTMYEEVNIPASGKPPVNVGKELVPISSLDKVGQAVFAGMETLNRIQSVVFETAYGTNENLLICAPTGAGKTNIALLALTHQIKQHITEGVIRKDEFKIVYVAPMKALAAEMTANFSRRLAPLGLQVRELTGDMQLTKAEMTATQVLVTTPEKWDVVTRKSTGDIALVQLVKLLIIDEVHLLHGDRGPVVEALVARTLRLVESSQRMIRIIGLSATLPNYLDVAAFLQVNPYVGLFSFDSRFRPVPLGQTFIGIKSTKVLQQMNDMDQVCYEKCALMVEKGHQVMVFVHARNATVRTALVLREMATKNGQLQSFQAEPGPRMGIALKQIARSRNKQLVDLFGDGFSIHHAGMLRSDRSMVEKLFGDGFIKVLVCTSTLAWGVNLPAHAVIIKGTEIYDAKHGSFVDLSVLDVLQIFGRAGRPQFDKSGHGTIITAHAKLSHYLSLLTNQYPIESNFVTCLADNLNAEIALGTVTNVSEAAEWLMYSYLYVRMRRNPQAYGLKYNVVQDDPQLLGIRLELIAAAAKKLDAAKMIRYAEDTGYLYSTDLGRTASHYYIKYDTVEIFNDMVKPIMDESRIIEMISHAQEFEQLKVRDDEMEELDEQTRERCEVPVFGGSENTHGKVNILIQTFISRGRLNSFSLISDQNYVIQNAVRIARALFEIHLLKNNALLAGRLLKFSLCLEQQIWGFESALRQFRVFGEDILVKLEQRNLSIDRLRDMSVKEIGLLVSNQKQAAMLKSCAEEVPRLELDATVQPITRTVLRITVVVTPDFNWNDRFHGKTSESFWFWVEDPDSCFIYHHELFILTKRQVVKKDPQRLVFTIPVGEPLPSQYYVRVLSNKWVDSETVFPVSFKHLILPQHYAPHTELLNLDPLPKSVLEDPAMESLYSFSHFNPVQTHFFHCLYHTDSNALIGAPTGSGKTVAAELCMFRVFRKYPGMKCVYIAPLKALVRERMEDWKVKLTNILGKKVVELTGDVTPDMGAIAAADVIVTTPEKWDGISRSWQHRSYVQAVALIVIDEIHLLGEDRGPVLEVIVSRTNFIAAHTHKTLRVVGLSTALANALDLAHWLGIGEQGLYNFRPSVRPVPLEIHIAGFPGKHYCPRMATMNKPTFQAIKQHSPHKPTLVFVSSRRQTRLTALDLISFLASDGNPKQWLHTSEDEMSQVISGIKDMHLKLTLAFGIGVHHAGLQERDRRTVEELFVHQKIQILVATATLAWGVNFPAHLVVIKGTEYYDGKTRRYVDMPITDVLQMMGRAGRPQFDDRGVACVLVQEGKKNFYKKFLYDPFPVESSLLEVLPDHINAEVVAGTIKSKQDVLDYLTWTYFFRRLVQNPSFYHLETLDPDHLNKYLSGLAERAMQTLQFAGCVEIDSDNRGLMSTPLGRIASYYYLSHETMQLFRDKMGSDLPLEDILDIMTNVKEYEEIPVRHNEDIMNGDLAKSCPVEVNPYTMNSPHTKAHLLFQSHFSRLDLPCSDYFTDLKSILDQAIRIVQAMIDVCADRGWLQTTLRLQQLMQMIVQGRWVSDPPILTLPHLERHHLHCFQSSVRGMRPLSHLPQLVAACSRDRGQSHFLQDMLQDELEPTEIEEIRNVLSEMPQVNLSVSVRGWWDVRGEEVRPLQLKLPPGVPSMWYPIHCGQEYTLVVEMQRLVGWKGRSRERFKKVHAPHFPKPKDEGWFLVLGTTEDRDLVALKRVSTGKSPRNTHYISLRTPDRTGRIIYTLYVMSDSYLGLDQQYSLKFELLPASAKAMPNLDAIEMDNVALEEDWDASPTKKDVDSVW